MKKSERMESLERELAYLKGDIMNTSKIVNELRDEIKNLREALDIAERSMSSKRDSPDVSELIDEYLNGSKEERS